MASRSLELEIYSGETLSSLLSLSDEERCANSIGGNYRRKRSSAGVVEKISTGHRGLVREYLNPVARLHIFLIEAIPFEENFAEGEILGYELYLVEQAAQKDSDGSTSRFRYGITDHLHDGSVSIASHPKKGTPLYQRGYSDDPAKILQKASGTNVDPNSLQYPAEWRPIHLIKDWSAKSGRWCFPLPTFVLQKNTESARAWVGSCFKLHGQPLSSSLLMYDGGAKSADAAGQLYTTARSPDLRPHMLILMGDQIYADDVAFVVAEGIAKLRNELTAEDDELLPAPMDINCNDLDWRQRRKFVGRSTHPSKNDVEYSPFRLENGVENQMFTFSEYAALYLYHLNPALWFDMKDQQLSLSSKDQITLKNRLKIEYARLSKNRMAVLQYATVKANLPIFTQCDDHEVTDDWFFDKEWIDAIRPSADNLSKIAKKISVVGQYIVSNAMYAYYAFQALGNCQNAQVQSDCLKFPDGESYQNNLKVLLDASWSFIIPSTPPILCLDTRTKRSGIGDELTKPSSGFDRVGLDRRWEGGPGERSKEWVDTHHDSGALLLLDSATIESLLLGSVKNGRIIIVTPSPVLSSDNIALRKENVGSARENDAEGWRDNYSNYFQLVDALLAARVEMCIVISGDFHYGYRRKCVVLKKSLMVEMGQVTIDQIVSSPILNPYEREFGSGRSWLVEWLGESNFVGDYSSNLRYTPSFLGTGSAMNRWRITPDDDEFVIGVPPPCYVERLKGVLPDIKSGKVRQENIVWSSHFVEVIITSTVDTYFYVQERE